MRVKYLIPAVIALLLLAQCKNETAEKLNGIWQVDKAEVNGTTIDGSTVGAWLWEFNDEGGYLIIAAGAKDKGTFKLSGKNLTLKSQTFKERAETVYQIQAIDSANLVLYSESNNNKSTFRFIRKGEGEIGEDD